MKEKNNHIEYKLVFLAVLCLSLSRVTEYTSPFIFVGLSPLFGLHDLNKQQVIDTNKFFLLTLCTLFVSFLAWQLLSGYVDRSFMIHGLLMSLAFMAFWFTNKYAKNRIGYFTVIIYWVALEYCSLFIPGLSDEELLLANTLIRANQLAALNVNTGLLGVSVWIMVGNVLFYHVFIKNNAIFNKQFRWRSFIYTILFLSIAPMVVYFMNTPESISNFLQERAGDILITDIFIDLDKEYLGRTCLWVSVLMICYGFVKRQTH